MGWNMPTQHPWPIANRPSDFSSEWSKKAPWLTTAACTSCKQPTTARIEKFPETQIDVQELIWKSWANSCMHFHQKMATIKWFCYTATPANTWEQYRVLRAYYCLETRNQHRLQYLFFVVATDSRNFEHSCLLCFFQLSGRKQAPLLADQTFETTWK